MEACHTADEAYRKLMALKEERELAIENAEDNIDQLDINSVKARVHLDCYDQAKREVEYINLLIDQIQPHRKYRHLPDHEAFQACQEEEWYLQLLFRAQNYLLSQGTIPADELAAMRHHPQWITALYPEINRMVGLIKTYGALLPEQLVSTKLLEDL